MNRFGHYLLRFVAIIAGYVAASLAASAFMHLLFLGPLDWSGDQIAGAFAGSVVFSIPFIALFVAYFAFVPSLVIILVLELMGRRDWWSYGFGGGLAGAIVATTFAGVAGERRGDDVSWSAVEPRLWLALIGCGIVAGTAYWLVSGRWAGVARATGPHDRSGATPT